MRAACLLLVIAATGATSAASVASAAPSKHQEREARERYDRGMAKYAVRDFDGAITDFKTAYALTQAPGLLFNLGQASRLAKRPEEALYFYRTYLRQYPDAPNRRDVEHFIDRLVVTAGSENALPPAIGDLPRAEAPARVAGDLGATSTQVVKRKVSSGRVELGVGVTLSGAALAMLGGGIALGVSAGGAASRITASSARRVPWTPQLRAEWDDGQREAAAATALYVIGGAAAVSGVVLTVVGARRLTRGRFSAAPAPGGAQVAWACAF